MDKSSASNLLSKFGSPFADDEISYSRAPSSEYDDETERPVRPQRRPYTTSLLCICFSLLIASTGFNIYAFVQLQKNSNLDSICSTYTSQYKSPVSEAIQIKYDTVDFNGSFSQETIYRQTPSPEVDQAWTDLGADYQLIRIPEDRADDYGIPRGQAKIPERMGGGYPVIVEAFHHLHCINLLRQSTWFNYDYYRKMGKHSFLNDDTILQTHVGHCIDILRQQVMCTADYNVFGQWWIEGHGPFVDFNTKHTCKNFEDVRRWTEAHLLPEHVEVEKRPGDVILPAVP